MSESNKPKVIVRILTASPTNLSAVLCSTRVRWRNRFGRYWFADAKQYESAP
jgi:hypothetical protein